MDGYEQDRINRVFHHHTDDKEKNMQDIQTQRKEICEEIHKIRKSLNVHLDQLHDTLIAFLM
jgi:hypothetical protein